MLIRRDFRYLINQRPRTLTGPADIASTSASTTTRINTYHYTHIQHASELYGSRRRNSHAEDHQGPSHEPEGPPYRPQGKDHNNNNNNLEAPEKQGVILEIDTEAGAKSDQGHGMDTSHRTPTLDIPFCIAQGIDQVKIVELTLLFTIDPS